MIKEREKLIQAANNLVGGRVSGSRVLDLFARDGFLGLASLKWGARHVTFVDQNLESMTKLEEIIQDFELQSTCSVVCADALCTPVMNEPANQFGVVFIHPPRILMQTRPDKFLERSIELLAGRAHERPTSVCLILPAIYEGPIPFRNFRREECGAKELVIVEPANLPQTLRDACTRF